MRGDKIATGLSGKKSLGCLGKAGQAEEGVSLDPKVRKQRVSKELGKELVGKMKQAWNERVAH